MNTKNPPYNAPTEENTQTADDLAQAYFALGDRLEAGHPYVDERERPNHGSGVSVIYGNAKPATPAPTSGSVGRSFEIAGNHYTQYRIGDDRDSWLLHSGTGWLLPNAVLSRETGISLSPLTTHFNTRSPGAACGYHLSGVPIRFMPLVARTDKTCLRRRQLMWTRTGLAWFVNDLLPTLRISASRKKAIKESTLVKTLLGQPINFASPHPPPTQPTIPAPDNKFMRDQAQAMQRPVGVTEAVRAARTLADHVEALQERVRQLQAENTRLKSNIPPVSPPPMDTMQTRAKLAGINCNTPGSLSQYLSTSGAFSTADELVRAGLLNSDQLYTMFSSHWVDPETGVLINKEDFQDVLRAAFHNPNSTHRAPSLRAMSMRSNFAGACRVVCKKVDNPEDGQGNQLDIDNPAYKSNSKPCVRMQVRYTGAGAEYVIEHWSELLNTIAHKPAK